jgi:hypothetical protein
MSTLPTVQPVKVQTDRHFEWAYRKVMWPGGCIMIIVINVMIVLWYLQAETSCGEEGSCILWYLQGTGMKLVPSSQFLIHYFYQTMSIRSFTY